jgi:hypothetical protein
VDPASELDNFSIVVLELHQDHTRIVYCWTTTKQIFKKKLKDGLVKEHDFYGYCARKIRNLMKIFPCERIGMDAQGGGIAVEESLHDPDKLQQNEHLIWPVKDPEKEKDTDFESGLHILELVQFAKAEWTSEANHGLRKDMEDKVLLFPRFDPVSLGLALEKDKRMTSPTARIYDSLEDCVMDIEELKNELSTIIITRTGTGVNSRDRWDTPEVKLPGGRKGRIRKDRYSALLIANMLARQLMRAKALPEFEMIGNTTQGAKGDKKSKGKLYNCPDWYNDINSGGICRGINRGGV